ncbi:hypothetical protein ACIPY2_05620 [Paenarthrobacter sp. NPDC089675]|uniref:hypothetical protein n=1 Tax=Paenarthrobacter sp. NPDC089675 TaxID=3364376 RepID=UPI0038243462
MSHQTPTSDPNQPEPLAPHGEGYYETQTSGLLQETEPEPAEAPDAQAPDPFVPKKRFKMGRVTQILLAVLLVAVGFFAGVGVTKAMDANQGRQGRGQFQNFNGGQGRNRQSGAPTNGASPSAVPSTPPTTTP